MTTMDHNANDGQPILLTVSEAATLLRVSEKTLWNHTAPRGRKIPVVRLGKTLRYSRTALETWIAQQMSDSTSDISG